MTTNRKPSKPWRVIAPHYAGDHRSERAAYDALNACTADAPADVLGRMVTVWRWEDGDWRLYERAVITENGQPPDRTPEGPDPK